MSGFITEYLKQYPGADDWRCVEDFCGRCTPLGRPINICAFYSPSRHITAFGGEWYGTPDAGCELGDRAAWDHAMNNGDTRLAHEWRAVIRARVAKATYDAQVAAALRERSCVVKITMADGTVHTSGIGIRTLRDLLPGTVGYSYSRKRLTGPIKSLVITCNGKRIPLREAWRMPDVPRLTRRGAVRNVLDSLRGRRTRLPDKRRAEFWYPSADGVCAAHIPPRKHKLP